jgi:2-oxoglutarate dehydrogenase E2 component (dihydrolipoamide succinyltransferase)
MGESVLEATVTSWLKKEGEFVNVGDVLVELETDKVNLEVGAKSAGVLAKINAQEGEDVRVGDVLGIIDENAKEHSGPAPEKAPPVEKESDGRDGTKHQPAPQVTPVASRLALESGADVGAISGTGPEGRVTKRDVEQFLQEREKDEKPKEQVQPRPEVGEATQESRTAPSDREERIRMSRRRRTIAQRLLEAQQSTAMLTTFNDVDMGAAMDLRKRHNESFQARYGVKLGITSFFLKASISALKLFPRLNAEIQGDDIVLKHYYDIGIAIGSEDGLVVPVVRDAERLNFAEIERKINDFVTRTNEGKLSIEDLRGGTFTITNGGIFGSLLSTPILNPPQVGILGLHRIEDRPVAIHGEIVIRPMMYIALSYDHRIVDGREAVQFLAHIKELMEDPERLLLEN